jgi:thiol:disulfide interchange protein DsbD
MIPLTVSFFLKSAKTRRQGIFNALWYSFFIVLIYFLLSLPFVLFQSISSDSYNAIATGPLLNTAFFAIFVVFAFSFFGYYDISLPSSLGNKVDSLSGLGSVLGIFFMALTLAIISFTCTGAFIGNLLAAAKDANGGPWTITFGFTGFGLAFALPFGLFALFPHMLNSLPKSGGWLHQVKVFLGFVELIFALKFISNADLVLQLGLLKREVFLGIWAVLGLLLTLYLFGFIRFKGDVKGEKIAGLRAAVGIVALAFTSYCIYGLPGNALNLFSGFPPPMSYSIFYTKPKLEPIKNNYAEALARAKKEGKPIMIDYTGWACVNSRKMEENVWPDKEILPLLEKYIVVSLYVDDRTKLPENQQYVSKVDGTKRLTVGNKWSDDEVETMHSNSQPFYALISPDEKLLAPPRGNTPKIEDYKAFLECGLSTFEGMKHATK